jgi:hypothetical protein
MKELLLAGVLVLAGMARAEDFTTTMTPEERVTTGLDRLTPEQLARLKAVVERYKTGQVAVVRQEAATQVAAVKQEAEQKIVAAEAKARVAETKTAARPAEAPAAAGAEKKPSWLRALITLDKVSKQPDSRDAIESRIAGDFKGWRRYTMFNLENGQRWQADASDDYVSPPTPAPKVRIFPGMFNTFWMEIEGVGPRVRVKPVRLE